ncbi:MAG: hypothetical protein JJ869_12760 [Marivita sp.]|uniref:hypothetical protein n=1 Tax=Marivita sp. TaxID=2003365 RepID=UPI001B09EF34|nr:hypothetical protein [Marivita sp.]MBO6884433.1 hypothetical protein [Marivita sp.]
MLRPAILAITLLPTLAAAIEGNFLSCTVGAKQLSLSIQDYHITYSFGPDGKPELVLREPVATVNYTPWNGWGSTDVYYVTFYNHSYSYTVAASTNYENYRNGIHYYDINIWVERDGKDLAILECNEQFAGDPLDHLRVAKAAIGQCWNREREQWSENCAD